MSDLTTIITTLFPSADATGVILASPVKILFSTQIDEQSISENFFVTGPDTDTFSGPDLARWSNTQNDPSLLQSAGYAGMVLGTITFEKVNTGNTNLYTGSPDTTGAGNLWRTRAIFTPTQRLAPDTKYTAYLSGDEDTLDTLLTGIRSQTVFSTVTAVETGTGNAVFSGSYSLTSPTSDTFNVEVTTSGAPGVAKYKFWKTSAAISSLIENVLTTTQPFLLSDGVRIRWDNVGTLQVGDKWTVIVKKPTVYSGNVYWDFTTGSGAILEIPQTTSTSVIGTDPSLTLLGTKFAMDSSIPAHQAYNVAADNSIIRVTMNKNIDTTLFANSQVLITREPVTGATSESTQVEEVPKSITIDGDTLIIQLL